MTKIDWKRSQRFNPDSETDKILAAMEGWQSSFGDQLAYYKYNDALTETDPVYDEAVGNGLMFDPPVMLPCMHVDHIEGANENAEYGFYYNDDLGAAIPFDKFIQVGLSLADIATGNYLKDRIVYDRKPFRVTQLSIRGQIQQRDIIIGLSATQLKPDELVNDVQFSQWSLGGIDDKLGTE